MERHTSLGEKTRILAEIWADTSSEKYAEFRRVNNIALPLAFALAYNIIEEADRVIGYINECYDELVDFEEGIQ